MKTLGFVLTLEMAMLFFERVAEIERNTDHPMGKLDRQRLLMEMVGRKEAECFVDEDCPELVERKLMRKGAMYLGTKKEPPEGRSSPDGPDTPSV